MFLRFNIQVFELSIQNEYSSSTDKNKINFKIKSTMEKHTPSAYHYPHPPINYTIFLLINPPP